MIDGTERLIYTDPATDPYTTFDVVDFVTLVNQNQAVVDSTIGTARYDLGHVFFAGTFGVATGHSCEEGTKARTGTGFTLAAAGYDVARARGSTSVRVFGRARRGIE